MSKYYSGEYCDIINDIMKKRNWVQAVNQESNIKFSYSNKIQGDLMLSSDDEIKWLEKCVISKNEFTSYVRIYVIIVNSTQIFIYKEGKIYRTSKPSFFTRDQHYNSLFHNINIKIYETIKPELEKHPHSSNTFKIVAFDFGIDDKSVELISIDTNPDLSKEGDIIDKMKLHYWIINDLIDLFVFNNKNGHRWYECNDKKKPTYLINRSSILKNILNKNGWIEGKPNETVDFSYWDTFYDNIRVKSNCSVIPKNITNIIDSKRTMYTTLLKNNYTDFLPKTYIDLKNISPDIFNDDKIFFLKKHGGSGNKDVHVIRSLIEMNNICNSKYGEYILQEEVPNMYLHDNKYKCVIRSYGLIYNNNNYIYNDSKCDIYINEYSKTNTSNSIHNDEWNSVIHHNLTNMEFNSRVFFQIKNICNKLNVFFENIDTTNNFIILGYDFILDKNLNPYLIEVNSYPNLAESKDQPLKNRMLEDFADMVILNYYTKNNGFIDTSEYK